MVATSNDQTTQLGGQKKKKGDQKKALLEALRKPMTGSELLAAMHKDCPKTQLRDIWRLLKKLGARGLVHCLAPNEGNGRLYFFTEKGRRSEAFLFTGRVVLNEKNSVAPLEQTVFAFHRHPNC
jgi:Fe2+ or Zn2+ uptake regulation protein